MARDSSSKVVYAGIAGNLLVAVSKLIAATLTHSSAMLSEAVHSLVDAGNQALLLYGLHRSARPPDKAHPLGHEIVLLLIKPQSAENYRKSREARAAGI